MFFLLSKLFWAVARPLNLIVFGTILALLAARFGWSLPARLFLPVAGLAAILIGFTQLPDALLSAMEGRIAEARLPQNPAGIIVLGGGLAPSSALRQDDYHLGEAADRLVKGLELKRLYPQVRFIYSGGIATVSQRGLPETNAALRMIEAIHGSDLGVEFESRSRNTWENALYTKEMAGETTGETNGPWLLVTSAFHMPRAIGCFRQAGMDVLPVPTDFRADELVFPYLESDMAGQFLKMNVLVKELFGLIAYRLSGKTGEFLPR
jgi:uncharacterized SAM-binding protein YcdF (DUF218 family)